MAIPTTITEAWIREQITESPTSLVETLGEWCDEYPTLADEVRSGGNESELLAALNHDLSL